MTSDDPFRWILIAASLLVFPVGVYHRLRSQATRESLDRRQEGLFILLTLRPIGIATMIGFFAYMINPSSMAWSSMPLPEWLRWVGVAIGAAGAALLVWTLRSLGKNLTDTVVTRREHTLVTKGPYRWVRHPFYDAVALSMLANALVASNWFLLIAGALVFTLMVIRTRTEEEKLVARFGSSYRSYMERTGRFLPKFSGDQLQKLMLIGIVCLFSTSLAGQAPLAIDAGARVRVSSAQTGELTGRVDSLTSDTLVLRPDGMTTPVSISAASLTRVEVSRGRSRASSAWKRAKWGALFGAVPGAVSLGLLHEQVGEGSSVGKAAALGAWSGGLFGGAIGALYGAANPGENWERIR